MRNEVNIKSLQSEALELLQQLISTPSFSKNENETAGILYQYLSAKGVDVKRDGNNVWALNKLFDKSKPIILLNSHHDTVRPNSAYKKDPYQPLIEDGRLFGLGSNDAGGCLVSLLAVFLYYYDKEIKYNLLFAGTAEEEISGTGGVEMMIPLWPEINCAIVGEPTQMQMAVAERGLLVLDAIATGKAGHAARDEGINAAYIAIDDIQWFRTYRFDKISSLLGPVKMNVTSISTPNLTHNIVPAHCSYIVDVRVNELYTFEEILKIIRANTTSEINERSKRLRSTMIPLDHPLVIAGLKYGRNYFGSPTTSDKALMPFPALKMGPGDSGRSHTADEYIFVDEINEGISLYIQILDQLLIEIQTQ